MSLPDITVCSRREALNLINAGEKYDAVISINDPILSAQWKEKKEKKWEKRIDKACDGNAVYLYFWDNIDAEHWMLKDHLMDLMAFCRLKIPITESRVLIHCVAGVSRSTAAAVILLLLRGVEQVDAFQHVFKIRSQAVPNMAMIASFKRLLAEEMDLNRAIEEPANEKAPRDEKEIESESAN